MILEIKQLEGQPLSALMGVYFCGVDGTLSKPISIIIPISAGIWRELEADGNGRVRTSSAYFDRLFYDPTLGHSLIAPLILGFGGIFDGSERIQKTSYDEGPNKTVIVLNLDNKKSMELRFEDDEIYFRSI